MSDPKSILTGPVSLSDDELADMQKRVGDDIEVRRALPEGWVGPVQVHLSTTCPRCKR